MGSLGSAEQRSIESVSCLGKRGSFRCESTNFILRCITKLLYHDYISNFNPGAAELARKLVDSIEQRIVLKKALGKSKVIPLGQRDLLTYESAFSYGNP